MKGSILVSSPDAIVCPLCEAGELMLFEGDSARCNSCGRVFEGAVLSTLVQVASLPDALGEHACEECGHPEMRRLPDRVFHCPACGSEVLPLEASSARIRPSYTGNR